MEIVIDSSGRRAYANSTTVYCFKSTQVETFDMRADSRLLLQLWGQLEPNQDGDLRDVDVVEVSAVLVVVFVIYR